MSRYVKCMCGWILLLVMLHFVAAMHPVLLRTHKLPSTLTFQSGHKFGTTLRKQQNQRGHYDSRYILPSVDLKYYSRSNRHDPGFDLPTRHDPDFSLTSLDRSFGAILVKRSS